MRGGPKGVRDVAAVHTQPVDEVRGPEDSAAHQSASSKISFAAEVYLAAIALELPNDPAVVEQTIADIERFYK